MDTRQITAILKGCKVTSSVFKGVYALDFVKHCHGPGVYVCNTQPSSMPGEHWIVLCVTNDNKAEYFDSFGFPPMKREFKQFLAKTSDWSYNEDAIQHPLSTVCGHYCVLYAINFAKNRSIDEFMSMFGGDVLENDKLVHDYVSSTFNIDVPLIDVNMITNQLGY